MPRIYIDTCVWGRPFDKPTMKITQEENAFYVILEKAVMGEVEILGSVVLDYEVSRVHDPVKKEDIQSAISYLESEKILEISKIERKKIMDMGFKPMDSSHLAIAATNSEYFITVDREILNKRERIEKTYKIKIMNPVEFVKVVE